MAPPAASMPNASADEEEADAGLENEREIASGSDGEKVAFVKPSQSPTCWYRFRRSKVLVVLIVFIAMMLDLMLITSVEPILPPLVYSVMQPNATERFLASAFLFQAPDDDKRVEMVATGKKTLFVQHFHFNNLTNHTMIAPELLRNCSALVDSLRERNATFALINNGSAVYLRESDAVVNCCQHHHNDSDSSEMDEITDPYLVYALEMSTLFSLKPAAEIFSNILSGLIVNR